MKRLRFRCLFCYLLFLLFISETISGIRISCKTIPGTAFKSPPDIKALKAKLLPDSPSTKALTEPQTIRPESIAKIRLP